jgi:hypothetical protein
MKIAEKTARMLDLRLSVHYTRYIVREEHLSQSDVLAVGDFEGSTRLATPLPTRNSNPFSTHSATSGSSALSGALLHSLIK